MSHSSCCADTLRLPIQQSSRCVVLRDEAQALAEYFFGEVRPALIGVLDEELKELDNAFQGLLTLSSNTSRKSSYLKHIKIIQKLFPRVSGILVVKKYDDTQTVATISAEDQKIARTLEGWCRQPRFPSSKRLSILLIKSVPRIAVRP